MAWTTTNALERSNTPGAGMGQVTPRAPAAMPHVPVRTLGTICSVWVGLPSAAAEARSVTWPAARERNQNCVSGCPVPSTTLVVVPAHAPSEENVTPAGAERPMLALKVSTVG